MFVGGASAAAAFLWVEGALPPFTTRGAAEVCGAADLSFADEASSSEPRLLVSCAMLLAGSGLGNGVEAAGSLEAGWPEVGFIGAAGWVVVGTGVCSVPSPLAGAV